MTKERSAETLSRLLFSRPVDRAPPRRAGSRCSILFVAALLMLTLGAVLAAGKKEKKTMDEKADVVAVQARGAPGAYQFDVGIRSPDTGCRQYADWWEVVSEDGKLLYRRVLLHSHVDEQPFTRSGGPVPIQADTTVWVRAHMSTTGYGGAAFKGSPKRGFAKAELAPTFATGLAKQPPLPDGCAF